MAVPTKQPDLFRMLRRDLGLRGNRLLHSGVFLTAQDDVNGQTDQHTHHRHQVEPTIRHETDTLE